MQTTVEPAERSRHRPDAEGTYWRELLFWLLMLSAFAALSSDKPRRQLAGLIEACGFLVVAVTSAGRLRGLGLEFIAWERMTRRAILVCIFCGLLAGSIIVVVATWSGQPLGIQHGWNMAVLAIGLGPVLEEVIFRGYLLTFALWLTRRASRQLSSAISVICIAGVFAFAHAGKVGTTALQLICIVMTGCLYGWIRLHFQSTAAAALTHATYNGTLYLSYWSGV